ncbi:GntR family transcriptional regulator [Sphingobium sp. DEHP117]|uniref:GntR family transcriptional regulator n=1 Tax=Sphingobium sp. DEHP117 TaxID=2993436 RepID=UPI0027D5EA58|nr:GntR family transcriptional regulator [Sphingobium sp. DEHP117]MDQ4420376.1 GntR family transcriptional regulator [Sphingobium sp. DEHP117]
MRAKKPTVDAVAAAKGPPDSDREQGLPDRVVEAVHAGLMTGRYVPGQKLIESELTKTFGVSRGSLREGLKRLESDGVIVISRNRGAHVRTLTRKETMDLVEVLEVVGPFMVQLAAKAVKLNTSANVKLLDALLARLNKYSGGDLEYLDIRRNFYDTMISVADNAHLPATVPVMLVCLLRLQFLRYSNVDRQDSIEIDKQIVSAVRNGQEAEAARLMKRYTKLVKKQWAELPQEAFAN